MSCKVVGNIILSNFSISVCLFLSVLTWFPRQCLPDFVSICINAIFWSVSDVLVSVCMTFLVLTWFFKISLMFLSLLTWLSLMFLSLSTRSCQCLYRLLVIAHFFFFINVCVIFSHLVYTMCLSLFAQFTCQYLWGFLFWSFIFDCLCNIFILFWVRQQLEKKWYPEILEWIRISV